tara:strand:+ start:859 stop:969 length:111 start_codon:yes stop_codon:yes gene_type:complete
MMLFKKNIKSNNNIVKAIKETRIKKVIDIKQNKEDI